MEMEEDSDEGQRSDQPTLFNLSAVRLAEHRRGQTTHHTQGGYDAVLEQAKAPLQKYYSNFHFTKRSHVTGWESNTTLTLHCLHGGWLGRGYRSCANMIQVNADTDFNLQPFLN